VILQPYLFPTDVCWSKASKTCIGSAHFGGRNYYTHWGKVPPRDV